MYEAQRRRASFCISDEEMLLPGPADSLEANEVERIEGKAKGTDFANLWRYQKAVSRFVIR